MRLDPKNRKDEDTPYDNSGQAFEADVDAIYGIDEEDEEVDHKDKDESKDA